MARRRTELEELRSRLLDMTTRNNLLNYKPVTGRTVQLAETNFSELYKNLVLEDKGMTFRPSGKDETTDPKEKDYWIIPPILKKNNELAVTTHHTDVDLSKRLYALQTKSRSVFEEQGYPVLYLALGFVEWSDSNNKNLKAPLLMIPVELVRRKIKDDYTLKWSGEEPTVSMTLGEKFAEQHMELPELEHPDSVDDIEAYFQQVEAVILKKKWHITYDAVLDLFSFKKYVMFKDLDPDSWGDGFSFKEQPLLSAVFDPKSVRNNLHEMESLFKDEGVHYNIVDADSSQLSVIAEAVKGTNLVVEGPPGTGKSQTIVNMIAEMLALGRTVLFVSEKMAALEVVKRRLDAAGLSPYCLELHSQAAKKAEFLRELEKCMQTRVDQLVKIDEKRPIELKALDLELIGYCNELKTPIGSSGFTPYELYGIYEKNRLYFAEHSLQVPGVTIENVLALDLSQYQQALSALSDIQSFIPALLRNGETLTTHPWSGTRPGMIMPSDCDAIRNLALSYLESYKQLSSVIHDISSTAAIPMPQRESDIPSFIATCDAVLTGFEGTEETLRQDTWSRTVLVNSLIQRQETIYLHYQRILEKFTPDILTCNPDKIYETYMRNSSHGFKLFSNDFKELKYAVTPYYRTKLPSKDQILADLREVRDYLKEYQEWQKYESAFKSLFSAVWKGEDTSSEVLYAYTRWVRNLAEFERDGRITKDTYKAFAPGNLDLSVYSDALQKAYSSYKDARKVLYSRLSLADEDRDIPLASVLSQAEAMVTRTDRLEEWGKFLTYIELAEKTSAKPVIPYLLSGKIDADALIPTYVAGFAASLLKEAYKTRTKLARFSQASQETKIETFRLIDKEEIATNAQRIARILDAKKPDMFSGDAYDEELSVLLGEFARKRGHMSIRSLMTKAGGTIQKIKPCFMMSPLSVAQYLDPRSVMFDIIIFDEASQVRPEDALGALMRGRQLVVMGDSRQLPPTTFFDSVGSSEPDDDQNDFAAITDMESLLHVCKQVFPSRRLSWHYRSRHESLIAVSNAEFYDGNLMVFPSPKHETDDLGISFHHLPDTIYDRGNTGVNRGEARAVAEAVISYYKKFPDKSLGVATFSTKQQEAVRREVNILLRDNPKIEALMHPANGEEFFVKNLETVQGDERDTILISIGYGFDSSHHLSSNFGPLNQTGGERRLNVLITRARERCVVFSNFRGYDIPMTPETSSGLKSLSRFLTYAESRDIKTLSPSGTSDALENDTFSATVSEILQKKGYKVERNVGCAGFRIDIAVADPKIPGVFCAGILCDSRYYWQTSDTRDRDRLRTQILEGLGWNILRVWAPEWFQHPESCIESIIAFIEKPKPSASIPAPELKSPEKPVVKKQKKETPVEEEDDTWEELDEPEEQPPKKTAVKKAVAAKYVSNPPKDPIMPVTGIVPYVRVTSSVLQNYHQFASVPDKDLEATVVDVILTEGPISESLLLARIKELGNVPRMTQGIKDKILQMVTHCLIDRVITTDIDGFYCSPEGAIVPRVRSEKFSILDVSRYEIAIAAGYLLAHQYRVEKDDLVKRTSLALGFPPSAQVKLRVNKGIEYGCNLGLMIEENGYYLAKQQE